MTGRTECCWRISKLLRDRSLLQSRPLKLSISESVLLKLVVQIESVLIKLRARLLACVSHVPVLISVSLVIHPPRKSCW